MQFRSNLCNLFNKDIQAEKNGISRYFILNSTKIGILAIIKQSLFIVKVITG